MRRIGVLVNRPADDPDVQHLVAAFLQELQLLGWRDGNNVRIEYRFAADQGSVRRYAAELIALAPEVILAYSQSERGGIAAGDPHPAHRVHRGQRPCRHRLRREPGAARRQRHRFHLVRVRHEREIVGTAQRDRAPRYASGRSFRDPSLGGVGAPQFAAIQAVAGSFGVELSPLGVRDAGEVERSITAFARGANGGLIVTRTAARNRSSRPDRRARGPVSAAGGLSFALVRHQRRPDLLRAGYRRPVPARGSVTSIASSRARSRPICRCRTRPSTSW